MRLYIWILTYCWILFIRDGQCSCVTKMFLVLLDIISLISSYISYIDIKHMLVFLFIGMYICGQELTMKATNIDPSRMMMNPHYLCDFHFFYIYANPDCAPTIPYLNVLDCIIPNRFIMLSQTKTLRNVSTMYYDINYSLNIQTLWDSEKESWLLLYFSSDSTIWDNIRFSKYH